MKFLDKGRKGRVTFLTHAKSRPEIERKDDRGLLGRPAFYVSFPKKDGTVGMNFMSARSRILTAKQSTSKGPSGLVPARADKTRL